MTNEGKKKKLIRNQAEEIIALQNIEKFENIKIYSLHETKKIIHELEVHQIELEMQNEELLTIQNELDKSKKRYFDLHDMAPIGYCTLDVKRSVKIGS